MEKKSVVELDEYDKNILIRALNDLRTKLIEEQRSTDAVDELMVKVYEAKRKRLRVAEDRDIDRYR